MNRSIFRPALAYLCAALGRYTENDGTAYLQSWVEGKPSPPSLDVFKAVVDEFADKKEAADRDGRKWSRPSVRQITKAYERRMNNQQRADQFSAGSDCGHCDGAGFVHYVVAGSTPFDAKPVPESRFDAMEPCNYVTTSVAPCICGIGSRMKGRENWSNSFVSRIVSDFAAPGRVCDRIAFEMRLEYECGLGAAKRTTMQLPNGESIRSYVRHDAPNELPDSTPATPRQLVHTATVAPDPQRKRDDNPSLVAADANDASDADGDWF